VKTRLIAITTVICCAAFLSSPLRSQNQGNPGPNGDSGQPGNPGPNGNSQDQHPDGKGDRTRQTPPRAGTGAAVPTGNGISFHGGPVMMGTKHIYYIFYGSWPNSTVNSMLVNFASNIGGSPYFNINNSYTDGSGAPIPNSVTFVSSTTDNYSLGTSLNDGSIKTIVQNAINSNKLPLDANGVYFVLTSADVNETTGFCTQYCGWHTYAFINGTYIKYSFVGNADRCPGACSIQSPGPNGTTGPDAMVSVIAHELEEAATDPLLNAWYDSQGEENADKCAWTFGSTQIANNGAQYNVMLGGAPYMIQQNWVNASGGYCAMSYTSAPPTPDFSLSVSPSSRTVVQGNLTSYGVTITGSNGFADTVNLSVSGLPGGASASFSPNPASSSSTLNVTTSTSTPAGTSALTITGTGTAGSPTHAIGATLIVSPRPLFSISVTPASRTVSRGGSTTYSVTVTPAAGFTGTVNLSVTGLPNRAGFNFSPSSLTGGGGTSTLTVSTAKQSHGTSTLTISGTGGGQTQQTTATIVVN